MSPNSGQWILIDMLNEDQFGLLSIGRASLPGSSLRKGLDSTARELLMERVKAVHLTADPIDEIVELNGTDWRIVIDPLQSPTNHVTMGAQAIFSPVDEPLPAKPVIGSIEWLVKDGSISTVWDDNMFRLYDIVRGGAPSATGDMNRWVNSLIAPEDRARMKVVIDGGLAAPDGKRHKVAYRVITGDGGSKHLEALGRVYNGDDDTKWLRSITREVSHLTPVIPPTNVDMSSGGLLHAAFELSRDRVLLAVDMTWMQIFMTSPGWKESALVSPPQGYLPDVIHPDDVSAFSELCRVAQNSQPPVPVRFLQENGGYRRFEVSASDGHLNSSTGNRYVIASLKELPDS